MENQHFLLKKLKVAIAGLPNLSQKLIGIGKPYEALLLAILKLDPDGNERFPTDKAMMKDLDIKPYDFQKWKYQIYADLIELLEDEDNPKFEVKKLEHHISCCELDKWFFFATTLPETPRVGSSFCIDFFRPISNHYHYYVDSVSYRVLDCKMIVDIRLRTDFFNSYVKFKEEQEEYEANRRVFGTYGSFTERSMGNRFDFGSKRRRRTNDCLVSGLRVNNSVKINNIEQLRITSRNINKFVNSNWNTISTIQPHKI
jgi:hypothetical protein